MRLGVTVAAVFLLSAGCGGGEGITVTGPVVSLTSTEACLATGGPGSSSDDETCYRIEDSSEIDPGLGEGDLVTLKASDGVVVELTPLEGPEVSGGAARDLVDGLEGLEVCSSGEPNVQCEVIVLDRSRRRTSGTS